MFFLTDGFDKDGLPSVTKYGYEDLEDAPHLHRWRAYWEGDGVAGPCGISLKAFPVVKQTPCGVWVASHAYRATAWQKDDKEWHGLTHKRFMMNNKGQSWAKPTQDEAIESLAIRLARWSNRIAGDVARARAAAESIQALRPHLEAYGRIAKRNLS